MPSKRNAAVAAACGREAPLVARRRLTQKHARHRSAWKVNAEPEAVASSEAASRCIVHAGEAATSSCGALRRRKLLNGRLLLEAHARSS